MAESVSAANEVKLTEADVVNRLFCQIEQRGSKVKGPDYGVVGYFIGADLLRELRAGLSTDLLAARLSAREPDNETVERRMEIAWNQGRKVGMEHGYETTGPHSNPYRSAARTAAFDYLATLKTTAPVETPPPAVPVSGVPTEAVRELAEQVHDWIDTEWFNGNVTESAADRLRALVQRAAETNESGTP